MGMLVLPLLLIQPLYKMNLLARIFQFVSQMLLFLLLRWNKKDCIVSTENSLFGFFSFKFYAFSGKIFLWLEISILKNPGPGWTLDLSYWPGLDSGSRKNPDRIQIQTDLLLCSIGFSKLNFLGFYYFSLKNSCLLTWVELDVS